ncbi:hypothetical protein CapIbe_017428 [Capra ibex]
MGKQLLQLPRFWSLLFLSAPKRIIQPPHGNNSSGQQALRGLKGPLPPEYQALLKCFIKDLESTQQP